MTRPTGVTGRELTGIQWLFAFSLVTTLFFTWGFAYGLLDVLNSHFQTVFGISKLQSTLLQLAYFGAYLVYAPIAGVFVSPELAILKGIYSDLDSPDEEKGIHMGLTLYSLGAIFFWPSAKFEKYGGFVGCTFVIGCGLSCLEVAANSYISVLGAPHYAAMRLNFSQGFQGVASFAGPLIASTYFFRGKNANTLDTVQWVYLAVAGLGIVLNILFFFCPLPEITEEALTEELAAAGKEKDVGPFWKQYRCVFGWIAQTSYTGAQVGVAAFVVNFLVDKGRDHSKASIMFSMCQLTFTGGRFVSVVILKYIDSALLLTFYGLMCCAFSLGVAFGVGDAGITCLYCLFFFESICYPVRRSLFSSTPADPAQCIFTLGTKNLGV
ncbi:hypothetical protein EWM64_g9527, partial [Hericium alpestre]